MAQIDEVARVLGHRLPADVSRLYLWHDGATMTGDPFDISPSYHFLDLHAAVEARAYLNQLHRSDLADDEDFRDWQPHWLPIGYDTGGNYIIVETAGLDPGRLFELSMANGPRFDRA
jgi:cell wall assembly regulator SMI1